MTSDELNKIVGPFLVNSQCAHACGGCGSDDNCNDHDNHHKMIIIADKRWLLLMIGRTIFIPCYKFQTSGILVTEQLPRYLLCHNQQAPTQVEALQ